MARKQHKKKSAQGNELYSSVELPAVFFDYKPYNADGLTELQTERPRHYPVLWREIVEHWRRLGDEPLLVDGTLGEGGHTGLFHSFFSRGSSIGCDFDPVMLGRASTYLNSQFKEQHIDTPGRLQLFEANFSAISGVLKHLQAQSPENYRPPSCILLDLGVSRFHFDGAGRGFSINDTDELDMRLSPALDLTARRLLETIGEDELARILFTYGEEKNSRKIAARIVKERRETTFTAVSLAELVAGCIPRKFHGTIHPATRTFQALRIFVNREIAVLEQSLEPLARCLAPGGMLMVISFHSLEDRVVKQAFKSLAAVHVNEETGARTENEYFTLLTKKPIIPGRNEIFENKKSRSAKLRILARKAAPAQL